MSQAAEPAALEPGGDYNLVPYVSNAFAQSDPARLFGFARLFALTPPKVETARVLELGCASGGNIIPLAVRYPGMRITGIDLTPRHVEDGVARIRALGLANIEIRQGDIATFDPGAERFDAILCHGVYSWVPPEAQAGILRIAARNLSPDGVAYVSYNVLPGWHLRTVIRDLMLFHAGPASAASPERRIAKARWVIDNVANMSNAGSPYGAKLREEAKGLANVNDAYILGEFLAPWNEPCYFRDFLASADRAGLAFLCESELESCLPETHGPQVAQLIRTMSANQLMPMEQYIDFFVGRQFRQTLLVRKDQEGRIGRALDVSRVAGLPVHGRIELVADQSTDGKFHYRTPQGRTVTTTNPVVRQALDRLAAASPETRTAEELADEVAGLGVTVGPGDRAAIRDTVFKIVIAGLVKPSHVPVRVGRGDGGRPVACPLARADAASGRPATTNRKHETVGIDAVNRTLLPLLDGTSGHAELLAALERAAVEKRITVTDDKTKEPLEGERRRRALGEHIGLALKRLAGMSLLLPAGAAPRG